MNNLTSKRRLQRILLACLGLLSMQIAATETGELNPVEGRLDLVWGDPQPGTGVPAQIAYSLTDDSGSVIDLNISSALSKAHGGFVAWNGLRVRAYLPGAEWSGHSRSTTGSARVHALTLLEGQRAGSAKVFGSQPWVSILCKFADINDEPEDLAYFQGMYENAFGGLDDYWRAQSYNAIDIQGSTAVDWVVLPENRSAYIDDPNSGSNLDRTGLFEDCTAAADPFIDFANGGEPFSGINQMFNARIGCCAWGGGRFATLDGVTKSWRVTWEPPWAYANMGVIAHEMGHGFGLPHANNFDGDSDPYDSPWDVMSAATRNGVNFSPYGRLGKHHTAYHKNRLGWIVPDELLAVEPGQKATGIIDPMTAPTTGNYRMARISTLQSNEWYTVETRNTESYDDNLPGTAVIISQVQLGRSEPAWAVDVSNPPGNFGSNEGTMFRVGESFTSPDGRVVISVNAQVGDGFEVTVNSILPEELFVDGFESSP